MRAVRFHRLPASCNTDIHTHNIQNFLLPNGLCIACTNAEEVPFLYNEVFCMECYGKHNIRLPADSVILDVGANIGMATMYFAAKAGPLATVIAMEPLPPLHAACKINIQRHQEWCAAHNLQPASVHLLCAGAGDGSFSQASFQYYRKATGWSTMYPDNNEVEGNMDSFLDRALVSMRGLPETSWLAKIGQMLKSVGLLSPVYRAAKWMKIQSMLQNSESYTCDIMTLSEVMAKYNLTRVDVLKVDVERAELDVLRGVCKDDWNKVHSVVMEVHDADGRLETVKQLLEGAGFALVLMEQDADLVESNLYNLYAVRK